MPPRRSPAARGRRTTRGNPEEAEAQNPPVVNVEEPRIEEIPTGEGASRNDRPMNERVGQSLGQNVPLETLNEMLRILSAQGRHTRTPIERLRNMGAKEFTGKEDPETAYLWLRDTERILAMLDEKPFQRMACVAFLMKGVAYDWWELMQTKYERNFSWDLFVKEFDAMYYPQHFKNKMSKEFLNLKQHTKTVDEYRQEFIRLSRFALALIPNEAERIKRFKEGLRFDLQMSLVGSSRVNFHDMLQDAMEAEQIQIEKRKFEERKRGASGSNPSPQPSKKPYHGGTSSTQNQSAGHKQSQGSQSRSTQQRSHHGSNSSYGPPTITYNEPCKICSRRHPGECKYKNITCYTCGKKGHFSNQCPEGQTKALTATTSGGNTYPQQRNTVGQAAPLPASHAPPQLPAPPPRLAIQAGSSRPSGQPGRPPGRAYHMSEKEAMESPDVVTG